MADDRDTAFERHRRAMGWWLLAVCALTFLMVVIGGLTRLTESGLSMVEWKPVTGVLPPFGERAWQEAFEKYQQFPEYQKVNRGMSLADFKSIYWFEYVHRLLGRTIGLAFLGPLVVFMARRAVPRRLAPTLVALFFLGGLQGLIGWWMVASGLVDRPDVSHLRLTVHLGAAFLLMAALAWIALDLFKPGAEGAPLPGTGGLAAAAPLLWAFSFLTVLSGGLVAGLNAGFMLNTFPLMAGRLVPPGMIELRPAWQNLLDNPVTVQFDHRVLALTLLAAVTAFWALARRRPLTARARRAVNACLGVALLQVGLGITTLLSVVWIPLASAHQAEALLLFLTLGWTTHELRRPLGLAQVQRAAADRRTASGPLAQRGAEPGPQCSNTLGPRAVPLFAGGGCLPPHALARPPSPRLLGARASGASSAGHSVRAENSPAARGLRKVVVQRET